MTTPTSGAADLPEALHRVIDGFERRERGIPQAHIAAALVTELRAALAAGQTAVSAIDASPSAASIAWNALRDATDPLGELGARIMGHVRIFAQRQYEAGRDEVRPAPPAMDGGEDAEQERPVQRMEGWTDTRYVAELENVVRLLRRDREKLHRVRDALSEKGGR